MNSRMLTTGQAAKLCSVTPDTVLKWIHSGALPARRTAGGHHRIDEQDLTQFVGPIRQNSVDKEPAPVESSETGSTHYCWEYNNGDEVPTGCQECVVYKMRAQRCYEVAKLATGDWPYKDLSVKATVWTVTTTDMFTSKARNVMVVTDDRTVDSKAQGREERGTLHPRDHRLRVQLLGSRRYLPARLRRGRLRFRSGTKRRHLQSPR